jgi:hypothetical protein
LGPTTDTTGALSADTDKLTCDCPHAPKKLHSVAVIEYTLNALKYVYGTLTRNNEAVDDEALSEVRYACKSEALSALLTTWYVIDFQPRYPDPTDPLTSIT